MPAVVIGAGIAAAGSVASGVIASKAASKANKAQQQSAAQQLSYQRETRDKNEALFQPDVSRGETASVLRQNLLGMGDPTFDRTAYLRATPGYQFSVSEALRGVNSNAYASGLGNSGAAYKALQTRAMGLADTNFNSYLAQVGDVANAGSNAKGAVAGISTNFANQASQISQNAADSKSNSALARGAILNNSIAGVLRGAGQAFGSSYGNPSSTVSNTPYGDGTNMVGGIFRRGF